MISYRDGDVFGKGISGFKAYGTGELGIVLGVTNSSGGIDAHFARVRRAAPTPP